MESFVAWLGSRQTEAEVGWIAGKLELGSGQTEAEVE